MFVIIAKGVPCLPFCAITQAADTVALLVHLTHPNTWAVDAEQLKLRHNKTMKKYYYNDFLLFYQYFVSTNIRKKP